MNFHTETYGKWILAGEHAVLRGVPALVFPSQQFSMNFSYIENDQPLHLDLLGEKGEELNLVIWGVIENALQKVGRSRANLTGQLTIKNTLPVGAGLGASAALCVGVARLFAHKNWIDKKNIYEFSRELEGLFHGESSGVDIAVALEGVGLRFMRGGERTPLVLRWKPHLLLTSSGQRGVTADCIRKVRELWENSPDLGEKIDEQMREASELAEKSFQLNADEGFTLLAHAIDLGRDCFYQWGLCTVELDQHMREIQKAGAMAVKPTGSGGGGYVLSLWHGCDQIPDGSAAQKGAWCF